MAKLVYNISSLSGAYLMDISTVRWMRIAQPGKNAVGLSENMVPLHPWMNHIPLKIAMMYCKLSLQSTPWGDQAGLQQSRE